MDVWHRQKPRLGNRGISSWYLSLVLYIVFLILNPDDLTEFIIFSTFKFDPEIYALDCDKSTLAEAIPEFELIAFSTDSSQWLQVIPST